MLLCGWLFGGWCFGLWVTYFARCLQFRCGIINCWCFIVMYYVVGFVL